MDTKCASQIFRIEVKTLRKMCKDGCIPQAFKSKRKWDIPDETKIIIDSKNISYILFQLLKLKNNSNISFEYFQTIDQARSCIEYLYKLGFISSYDEVETDRNKFLLSVILSDKGVNKISPNNESKPPVIFYIPVNINNGITINNGINL